MDPMDECLAEFVGGVWTYCGCPDCDQRETEVGEFDTDYGDDE